MEDKIKIDVERIKFQLEEEKLQRRKDELKDFIEIIAEYDFCAIARFGLKVGRARDEQNFRVFDLTKNPSLTPKQKDMLRSEWMRDMFQCSESKIDRLKEDIKYYDDLIKIAKDLMKGFDTKLQHKIIKNAIENRKHWNYLLNKNFKLVNKIEKLIETNKKKGKRKKSIKNGSKND